MKKIQVRASLEALKTIKMAKIENKTIRNTLIKDHMALLDEQDRIDRDLRKLETAMLSGYKPEQRKALADRQDAVSVEPDAAKRAEMSRAILVDFSDLLAAQRAYNREAVRMSDKPVTCKLDLLPRDAMLAELDAQDFDFALLENIYPLLEPVEKNNK